MEQTEEIQQQQQPVMGGQMAYTADPSYQTVPSQSPVSPTGRNMANSHNQLAYQQHFHQHEQRQLQMFWARQMREIEQTSDFKFHSLPLARIKKVMKADEDVRMISSEAPVLFAKACEMFIFELTLRSWIHTEENKRRTLQKSDIATAISRTDVFDFLVDIIPKDELKEEGLGVTKSTIPLAGSSPDDPLPYYYVPPPPPQQQAGVGPTGTTVDQAAEFMQWHEQQH